MQQRKPCVNFVSSGSCSYGIKCHFSHDSGLQGSLRSTPAASLAQISPQQNRKPCLNFAAGSCLYGDKCHYFHDLGLQRPFRPLPHNQNGPMPQAVPFRMAQPKNPKTNPQNPKPNPQKSLQKAPQNSQPKPQKNQQKGQQNPQKKPKKSPALQDILKFQLSRAGVIHYTEQPKFKKFTYTCQDGAIRLDAGYRWRFGSQIWGRPVGAGFHVSPYDPFKMYSISESLHWYSPDLETEYESVELPYVAGATNFRFQGNTVIFFLPYSPASPLPQTYYEAIHVYKWDAKNGAFCFCFKYSRKDFHITCASSSSKYLILSRLPYSESELVFEHKAVQREQQLQQMIQDLTQNAQRYQQNIANLQIQLQQQQAFLRQEELRRQREAREAQDRAERLRRELQDAQRRAELDRINRDPVDLFVWDEENKQNPTFCLVMEYHKPADEVQIFKDRFYLVKDGATHQFEILLAPAKLQEFKKKELPVIPDRLCPSF